MANRFSNHAPAAAYDPESALYPVWNYFNLASIFLCGESWIKPTNTSHLKRMLGRLSALEYIEMPMEIFSLADCKFPHLKRFNLFLQSGGTNGTRNSSYATSTP
ncbi:hypothetical protein B0H11DRAFT_2216026 [Mycena galericulata]|nr:hypothetical protein B0H11DRAFT_2216026 [Mycena galericulata]